MKVSLLYSAFIVCCLLTGASCSDAEDMPNAPAKKGQSVFERLNNATTAGVVDVFDMPEMLTLSLMDSADIQDMPFKVAKNYAILEEEANAIGAEINVPGVINYNNDPKNFKFESLLLIKNLPAKEPTRCKIVVLESGKILVYNYYGPYENLYTAYKKIKDYCALRHLTQNGPMREFYLTDPIKVPDPNKWLTRIMVPID